MLDAREHEDEGNEGVYVSSVWYHAVPMHAKSNSLQTVQEIVVRIRRSGRQVSRVHSDQDKNFLALPFKRITHLNITLSTDLWFEDNKTLRVQMNLEMELCEY